MGILIPKEIKHIFDKDLTERVLELVGSAIEWEKTLSDSESGVMSTVRTLAERINKTGDKIDRLATVMENINTRSAKLDVLEEKVLKLEKRNQEDDGK